MSNSGANEKSPLTRLWMLVMVVMLLLIVISSIWLYHQRSEELRVYAQELTHQSAKTDLAPGIANLIRQADDWAWKITLATATTGAGVLLAMVFGFQWCRRAWRTRADSMAEESEEGSRQWQELKTDLQRQYSQRRILEEELSKAQAEVDRRVQERTAVLAKSYSVLEAELNERKHAEKALAQQAQELGRSKDVLELH